MSLEGDGLHVATATVIVAVPGAAAVTVNVVPATATVATAVADDDAEYVSASRSGSVKYDDRPTVLVFPASTVAAGMLPRGSGDRFGTVAWKLCVALSPPGSVAVTVIVALPRPTAVTVTVLPDAVAVATDGFDDEAL